MTAYNKLNVNVTGLKKSSEKLASGYRINRAGDDAAGLAVSEKMRSQIKGLNQAVRNAQDGINMIQTFEGAATNTHEILQRMKVLAEESSNGTYQNQVDRDALQLEFDQLNDELNQIADTDFNGVLALNGGRMADDNHVAPNPSQLPSVGETGAQSSMTDVLYDKTYSFTYDEDGKINGFNFAGNNVKITQIDDKSFKIAAGEKLTLNGIEWEVDTEKTITVDANGKITGADIDLKNGVIDIKTEDFKMDVTDSDGKITKDKAITGSLKLGKETYYSDGTKWYDANGKEVAATDEVFGKEVLTQNGLTVKTATRTAATGGAPAKLTLTATLKSQDYARAANQSPNSDVSIADSFENGRRNLTYADSITLQTGARSKDAVKFTFAYSCDGMGDLNADLDISARGLGTDQLNIASAEDANYAIDQIDNAINKTSMVRATFGSIQNRLEYKIDNLTTTSTNLQEAESNIRDTDMAQEMMNYTKYSILQQAAQSMLAQANQQPQSILQLLG